MLDGGATPLTPNGSATISVRKVSTSGSAWSSPSNTSLEMRRDCKSVTGCTRQRRATPPGVVAAELTG